MKRLHVHLRTTDLDRSVRFYSALLGKAPDRLEADYAKWLLDDPAANISVSSHGQNAGLDHVGISLDAREDLDAFAARLEAAGEELFKEEETTCCYARSNKAWARDPQGAVWELFQTFGDSDAYGADPERDFAPEKTRATTGESAAPCCA